MMVGDTFTDSLRKIWQQAKDRTPMLDEIIQEFRRLNETITLTETDEMETRGPGYLWAPRNPLVNQSFEADLTGWTESIDGGITATSARSIADAYTVEGSLGSMEVIMTAATGAGYAIRHQTITGLSPGEVWSVDGRVTVDALGASILGWAAMRFLSAADAVLASYEGWVASPTAWALISAVNQNQSLLNRTAPASTAKLKVELGLWATLSSPPNTGTIRFDLIRAEQASAISTRLTRPIYGEWAYEAS